MRLTVIAAAAVAAVHPSKVGRRREGGGEGVVGVLVGATAGGGEASLQHVEIGDDKVKFRKKSRGFFQFLRVMLLRCQSDLICLCDTSSLLQLLGLRKQELNGTANAYQ